MRVHADEFQKDESDIPIAAMKIQQDTLRREMQQRLSLDATQQEYDQVMRTDQ